MRPYRRPGAPPADNDRLLGYGTTKPTTTAKMKRFALTALLLTPPSIGVNLAADVIVYGSTPAGVLAAVAAAREGASVLLLDPRATPVGGMMSGGLGNTDLGTTTAVLGGLTRRFFEENCAHYYPDGPKPCFFANFEPSVALDIFLGPAFLGNASTPVAVHTSTRFTGLTKDAATGRIVSGVTAAGDTVSATSWVDATYEGALLPLAGVSTAFGREAVAQYNESVAGVLPEPHNASTPDHPFTSQGQLWEGLSPFFSNGSLIPLVTPPPGAVGSADDRLQAWNLRFTLTNDTANMLQPWPRPASYDPAQMELLSRYIAARNATAFTHTGLCCGATLPAAPGRPRTKFDVNSQRTDFQGLNWGYAQAVRAGDWAAQERILQAHRDLTLSYFYFLQNDARLPASLRASMSDFGLPLDEHVACGHHLPCQVYVREALRMVSDFVFTQADVEAANTKADSVGMGAYTIDVMHGSLYAAADPAVGILQEGGMQAPSFLPKTFAPFQIPFRALTPRRAEATNLLVPVALSASHVGFCAVRLEPTWTVLGESAGVAAAMAARAGVDVQDVDVRALQARLRALGQVLEL